MVYRRSLGLCQFVALFHRLVGSFQSYILQTLSLNFEVLGLRPDLRWRVDKHVFLVLSQYGR